MSTRLTIRAISPEAATALPASAFILGGLLLLIGP